MLYRRRKIRNTPVKKYGGVMIKFGKPCVVNMNNKIWTVLTAKGNKRNVAREFGVGHKERYVEERKNRTKIVRGKDKK